MTRSTRSLRVRSDRIQEVNLAVRRNGFPSQKALADHVGLALSTVNNFLTGRPVDYATFEEICRVLELEPKDVADLSNSPILPSEPRETSAKVFISHGIHEPDHEIAQQFCWVLQAQGYKVFMAGESLPPVANALQLLEEELRRCDYLLLLLSIKSAVSEMITENVRRAKELRDLSPDQKPIILSIRIDLSANALLNHDLRGYLHRTWHKDWQSDTDIQPLINEVLNRLKKGDFPLLDEPTLPTPPIENLENPPLPGAEPELPGGQVDLASTFYVERPPIEERCYATIAKPGALIRIKAPRQMGKTSLMARILHCAEKLGYLTVPLSFQLADANVFSDLERFLKWFCASISWQLGLPDNLADYWSRRIGSKMSCTEYFDRYLLTRIISPLVLGLDEVDLVFQYPKIAQDFFGLLRAWHEKARNLERWRRLRLVVVHSTEVYVPLNINQSPFNVGLAIELPEFSRQQVNDLAYRHRLNWDTEQVEQLMAMIGGHPFLLRVAMYHTAQQEMALEQILQTAPTESGLYSDHLRRHLWNLAQHPELAIAMKQVVSEATGVRLEAVQAFKLHSMGLVHLQGNEATPRCELYRQYFRDRL